MSRKKQDFLDFKGKVGLAVQAVVLAPSVWVQFLELFRFSLPQMRCTMVSRRRRLLTSSGR